jgi:hypothetical protein
MFQQALVVTYVDGTTADVTIDQWSIGEFANHCAAKGLKVDAEKPGMMAVTMLRFQAWAQLHRGKSPAPSYAAWNLSVASVDPAESQPGPVDPTVAAS